MSEIVMEIGLTLLVMIPLLWISAAIPGWYARHPRALRVMRIVLVTMVVLFGLLVVGIVLPLIWSPEILLGLLLGVSLCGYLRQRDREHRELLAALRSR
jgi:hypothetical protein